MSEFRLKVFVTVAECLSFTRASEELFISQPAISKHIHELETQYNTRLFERQGNKITLTASGQMLLTHSRNLLSAYETLEYDMQQLNHKLSGKLRIGASSTIAYYFLPKLLAQFKNQNPWVELSLISGNSHEIEHALQEQEIDLGLVEGNNRLLSLKYSSLIADELVAVVSTKHSLLKVDELTLEQLCSTPLVLRENGSGTLEIIKTALATKHIKFSDLNILIQLGSTESIKRFVESTNALAIVSIRSVDRELLQGTLRVIEIPELSLTREFSFVQRQGQDVPLAGTFINFALKEYISI